MEDESYMGEGLQVIEKKQENGINAGYAHLLAAVIVQAARDFVCPASYISPKKVFPLQLSAFFYLLGALGAEDLGWLNVDRGIVHRIIAGQTAKELKE